MSTHLQADFRVLVTGSRDWADARAIYTELDQLLETHHERLVIVHGACPTGADGIAAGWAERHGVRTEPHPAHWQAYGRAAGPRRNREMVQVGADLCLAWIRHASAGATDTAREAERHGILTYRFAR